jgi:hypothetical protein
MDKPLRLHGLEKAFDASFRLTWEDLLQILEAGPLLGFTDVLEEEFPLGGAPESFQARVFPFFSQKGHQATRGDDLPANVLKNAGLNQFMDARAERRRDDLLAIGQVQKQEVVSIKAPDLLQPDGPQEPQEAFVLHLALQGKEDLVVIRAVEAGPGL